MASLSAACHHDTPASSGTGGHADTTATGGTVVIVAINKGSAAATVPISFSGGTAPASLMPWLTSATDALAIKSVLTVADSAFTATLAATTVTTFVGK